MKYSFVELKKDLMIGHEVEFFYKKNKYSISHNTKGCYLTKYGEDSYQSFDSYEELINKALIDARSLKEVWNDVTIESVF